MRSGRRLARQGPPAEAADKLDRRPVLEATPFGHRDDRVPRLGQGEGVAVVKSVLTNLASAGSIR
jgi:hypothetical protein